MKKTTTKDPLSVAILQYAKADRELFHAFTEEEIQEAQENLKTARQKVIRVVSDLNAIII